MLGPFNSLDSKQAISIFVLYKSCPRFFLDRTSLDMKLKIHDGFPDNVKMSSKQSVTLSELLVTSS